jgi:hypothetical protein
LHDKCERMFLGWKNDPDFPKAFNIVTLIDHMDRTIPGVRARYDHLSEFAHPNWSGVSGLFSSPDHAKYTTQFGRGLRTPNNRKEMASNLLVASLDLFESAYNSISDTLPEFLAELEPLPAGPEERIVDG